MSAWPLDWLPVECPEIWEVMKQEPKEAGVSEEKERVRACVRA